MMICGLDSSDLHHHHRHHHHQGTGFLSVIYNGVVDVQILEPEFRGGYADGGTNSVAHGAAAGAAATSSAASDASPRSRLDHGPLGLNGVVSSTVHQAQKGP
ncbi:uncharacterized protein LOC127790545 isoform X2 [Diospyros lotus]|uniref:uncharacterized protein LOC127790545 isoform X2 n=1 Tax=Diospyros lotus TaxID=55363 RepID=UPI00224FABEC|nr:uncharacterized protein LOC127790545 isoform X2 [Diospyros lotus]